MREGFRLVYMEGVCRAVQRNRYRILQGRKQKQSRYWGRKLGWGIVVVRIGNGARQVYTVMWF